MDEVDALNSYAMQVYELERTVEALLKRIMELKSANEALEEELHVERVNRVPGGMEF